MEQGDFTYSAHFEVAEDTSTPSSHYTPVLDLCQARVAVHLRELELCLGTDTLGERRIADDVSEGLPSDTKVSHTSSGQFMGYIQ